MVGPGEGFRGRVVALDEGEQLRFQVGLAGEDAAPEQAAGEDREPELDLVEPGGVGGGEVEVPARVRFEPGDDLGCLVHLEVVEDRVHLLVGRDLGLELLEEVEELDAAVALVDVSLISPVCTSSAASSATVPWRLYSNSRRAGLPGSIGIVGRIGSLAWIEVFSSIETTIAPSGGLR